MTNKEYPLVAIGCPVQNRENVIKKYLRGIEKISYPKDYIIPIFLVNNSTDNTYQLILNWAKEFHGYRKIIVVNKKIYKGKQDDQTKNTQRDYTLFAQVRNTYLDLVKKTHKDYNFDYLFSIDSDIIINQPQTLTQLLLQDKDIISALVYNGKAFGLVAGHPEFAVEQWNCQIGPNNKGKYFMFPMGEIIQKRKVFPIDCTGACYLIKMKVILDDVRYGVHPQGEDVPFCESARKKGYGLWCDPTLTPRHLGAKTFGEFNRGD